MYLLIVKSFVTYKIFRYIFSMIMHKKSRRMFLRIFKNLLFTITITDNYRYQDDRFLSVRDYFDFHFSPRVRHSLKLLEASTQTWLDWVVKYTQNNLHLQYYLKYKAVAPCLAFCFLKEQTCLFLFSILHQKDYTNFCIYCKYI